MRRSADHTRRLFLVPLVVLGLGAIGIAPSVQAGFRPAPLAVTNPPVVEAGGRDNTQVLDAPGAHES